MKKTYLVKKNPNMPESEDNWIMMNGFEFARFMETPEGQSRKDNFGRLDSYGDNDSIFVIECGKSKAVEWRADKDAHDYLVKQEALSNIKTVSFNILCTDDDESSGENVIADPDCDVVSDLIRILDNQSLMKALKSLDTDEYQLIYYLFLKNNPVSERQASFILNMPRTTLNYRRKMILQKLKDLINM